jgi:hypothetical protein
MPSAELGQLGGQLLAHVLVAPGGLGVAADDEPYGVADPDFLDPHVAGDLGVAALALKGGLDLGGPGAELLADDAGVVTAAEVAAVAVAGESAVGHPLRSC